MSGRLSGKVALVTGAATGSAEHSRPGSPPKGQRCTRTTSSRRRQSSTSSPPLGAAWRSATTFEHRTIEAMFGRLDRLDLLVNCAGVTGWIDLAAPDEDPGTG